MSLSKDDFLRLTGLKLAAAEVCIKRFEGNVDVALCSVVQSTDALPASVFDDPKALKTHAATVNKELKRVYDAVRVLGTDAATWKSYGSPQVKNVSAFTSTPTPTSASQPQSGGFVFKAAPGTESGGFTFGFGKKPAAAPAEAKVEAPPKPKAEYGKPTFFTGCYLDMENFWELEVDARANLFNLDKGFLNANRDTLQARIRKWYEHAGGFYRTPVQYVPIKDRDEYYARVIIKDTERTFFETVHREKLAEFLHSMYHEFGSYGQAMSYLAGICLLGLTEEETAAVLRKVVKEYIPGHWASEAVGFATNAWTFEAILQEVHKDVAEHFNKMNFWPDTYLQKIMSGLCIHVLPFTQLFEFLDNFMEQGFPYLLKFCLGIIERFRSDLLKIDSPTKINELFSIMRLDASTVEVSDIKNILKNANRLNIDDQLKRLDNIRSEAYDKKVGPRMQRAPKVEAFEPCFHCNVNKPTWYSDTHGITCSECKAKLEDKGDWEQW